MPIREALRVLTDERRVLSEQPVLLLRGAKSDLLSAETAGKMMQRGPRTQLQAFAGPDAGMAWIAADHAGSPGSWRFMTR